MAKPSLHLIHALRKAAAHLRNGAHYAWGNHGACNCGHLLQVLTNYSEADIIRSAHTGNGEWTELAEEYCDTTHLPVGHILTALQDAGLTPSDINHIEYLTDKDVLRNLDGGFRWLRRNVREDVIDYFESFANLLEDKLQAGIQVNFPALFQQPAVIS